MSTVEERVARLEGRVQEHSQLFTDLRESIASLERRMEARFAQVDRQFDVVRAEIAANFKWVVGIQVTTLIAIVAALLRR